MNILLFGSISSSYASCGNMSSNLRQSLYKSVVSISVEHNGRVDQGSGVIISSDGYIITSYHVVEGASRITINIYSSEDSPPKPRYQASIIESNPNLDISILKITRTSTGSSVSSSSLKSSLTPIRGYTNIELDDSVRVIGYSLIGRGTILNTRGDIDGVNNQPVGGRKGRVYLTDAVLGMGGSGGLVVNCDGVMVGIPAEISGSIGQLAVILPISTICSIDAYICNEYLEMSNIESTLPVVSSTACRNNGLPPQLEIGKRGRVTLYPDLANRVRSNPGTDGRILGTMQPGTSFQVLDGPVCENNINWWQVRTSSGLQGWTAEGAENRYYTEPVK